MLCNYFFKMPYKKGFSVKKRFKKEKLNKSKRLQAFKEHDNNKNIVQDELLYNEIDSLATNHVTTCATSTCMLETIEDNYRCQPLAEPIHHTPTTGLKGIAKTIKLMGLPPGWTLGNNDSESLKVVFLKQRKRNPMKDPMIIKSFTVNEDHTWNLRVHNKIVQQFDCIGLENLIKHKEIKSSEAFFEVLSTIHDAKICCGNPDVDLLSETNTMLGLDYVSSNTDKQFEVECNGKHFDSTIRGEKCHMLVAGRYDRCTECSKHRAYLRTVKSRQKKMATYDKKHYTGSNSSVNYRYLSSEGKTERLRSMQKELKTTKQLVNKLRSRLGHLIDTEGHVLDPEMNDDLTSILSNKENFANELPEGSFRRLLWEQQLQALSCTDARQMRWHPVMIKWCLNIKLRSSSAYKALRDSGFIKLPSARTLRDYTHWTKVASGFQPSSFERLLVDMKCNELKEWQKFVVLLHDEVKIKSDLVYCKHTGELIGFADLGEVNNMLLDFEKRCQENTDPMPDLATYMLVFMVRGITIRLEYPLAHFPCNGSITADFIFPLVWDAVRHLETIGIKVVASTSDGASTNRRFVKIHKPPKSAKGLVIYKATNIYSEEGRDLFFIADVPHLLKTVRNNWENSGWNKKTRQLWVMYIEQILKQL